MVKKMMTCCLAILGVCCLSAAALANEETSLISETAHENFGIQPVHDNAVFYSFRADRFEYQAKDGEDTMLWDIQA